MSDIEVIDPEAQPPDWGATIDGSEIGTAPLADNCCKQALT
jgi:hypothetical protein